MIAEDCVVTMLMGDGDADKVARKAIYDTTANSIVYTTMGAAVGQRNNEEDVMCDIIFGTIYD